MLLMSVGGRDLLSRNENEVKFSGERIRAAGGAMWLFLAGRGWRLRPPPTT